MSVLIKGMKMPKDGCHHIITIYTREKIMNNKKLGTDFEKQMVDLLSQKGYWVHFLAPDNRGAQPFDIIAVKDSMAVAIDCKTSKDHIFYISRLEVNQIMAFEKWIACGNAVPFIAVLYNKKIYMVEYTELKEKGKIDLESRFSEGQEDKGTD